MGISNRLMKSIVKITGLFIVAAVLVFLAAGMSGASELKLKEVQPNPHGGIEKLYLVQGQLKDADSLKITNPSIIPGREGAGGTVSLRIFHINDLHGHLVDLHKKKGNTHRFSQIVKRTGEAREKAGGNETVLFVSAGDDHIGTVFDELMGFSPEEYVVDPVYSAFSAAGIDASVMGNHEPDRGYDVFAKSLTAESRSFPVFSANLVDSRYLSQDMVAPAAIALSKGLRIGIIGLTTTEETKTRTREDPDVHYIDPVRTVSRIIPAMDDYVDVYIVLSHLGFNGEGRGDRHNVKIGDVQVAEAASGVTKKPVLIIGGHTHTALNLNGVENGSVIGNATIFQAGSYGKYVGEIELNLKKTPGGWKKTGLKAILHPTKERDDRVKEGEEKYFSLEHDDDYDKAFDQKTIEPLLSSLKTRLEENIGKTADLAEISTEKTIAGRYLSETALANFMDDSIVRRSESFPAGPVDIAVFNASGVASGVPVGRELTFNDWFSVMPYADTVVVFELTGAQVEEILQSNAKRIVRPEELEGENKINLEGFISRGFLHFSRGLKYTITLGNSPEKASVKNITIHDEPIERVLQKKYRIAFSTYIASGFEGWNGKSIGAGLPENIEGFDLASLPKHDTGLVYRNEIIQDIRDTGFVGPEKGKHSLKDQRLKIEK